MVFPRSTKTLLRELGSDAKSKNLMYEPTSTSWVDSTHFLAVHAIPLLWLFKIDMQRLPRYSMNGFWLSLDTKDNSSSSHLNQFLTWFSDKCQGSLRTNCSVLDWCKLLPIGFLKSDNLLFQFIYTLLTNNNKRISARYQTKIKALQLTIKY